MAYANRERREFESMVTCAVMTTGLRIRLDEAPTFGDLIAKTGKDLTRAVDRRLPLGDVIDALRTAGRTAPVVSGRDGLPDLARSGYRAAGPADPGGGRAPPASKAELTFGVTPARDPRYGYQTWAEHSTDLWHPRTAREWLRHYCTTLMICCRYPERPLARVTKAIRQDFLLASY